MKEKVVLAYSGGLDTTTIIPWLKEHFDSDVVCCCIDCGQGNELDGLEERAKLSGCLLYTSCAGSTGLGINDHGIRIDNAFLYQRIGT